VSTTRRVVRRTRGSRHGPITRLMSPSDLGQVLKPFVFLDLFDLQGGAGGTDLHPHSGIATVTYLFEGTIRYEDSSGATGVLRAGGVEWFKAARGAWHGGGPGDSPRSRGFQLWLALPPEQELGAVENVYLEPNTIARDGPARVLVGAHGGATSPLDAPGSITYVAVSLQARETWLFRPGINHTVAWISLSIGRAQVPETVDAGELAIFDLSSGAIDITAERDSEFVVGSAVPHTYDLVLGRYSVHTSPANLAAGEKRLTEIQHQLREAGRL